MSIQRKLLMLTLAVFTLATFFAALHGYRNSQQQVDALFDADLVNMSQFIAEIELNQSHLDALSEEQAKKPAVNANRVLDVELVFQIVHNGKLSQRSTLAPIDPIVEQAQGFKEVTFFGKRWRSYSIAVDAYVVVVAQPIEYRRTSAESIVLTTVAPIVFAMPVIAILLFYVIRKSLSSLVHLSQQLTYKNSDDLTQVSIEQPPKELEPVVKRLNSLLQRLSLAFERERTLSANTAHELRTPVSVLRLTSHNLRAAYEQTKLQESQFDELDANVMRMAHVIEQIIALYRYSPEHFSEQMREVPLDHLLREVIAENYEHIENAQQDISLEAIEAIVMAEPFALKILFENLLKNAMKYSGQASKIELSMQANDNYVDVLVENSGEIDTAEISRLTETFYRAKNANQSGVKGSGLGLSIVQYICHIHGGELQLSKSSLGGLAVKVRLKRLHSQAEAEGE